MFDIQLLQIILVPKCLIILKAILFDLLKIVTLLVSIAYYTLSERKIMAAAQRRKGPNVVGLFGLLQPLADGLKLLSKELVIPSAANSRIFLLAPLLILVLSLISWVVIPFGTDSLEEYDAKNDILVRVLFMFNDSFVLLDSITYQFLNFQAQFLEAWSSVANINYSVLFVLAISSFNVYGIIIAGWASNSKYAFLGSLRSAAQMISYEVAIGLVVLPVILLSGSLNFTKIILAQDYGIWYVFPLLPCAIIFFIAMLAETNRTPFDLTEAEAELVAGYNTEYSSIIFAMFFLAEYSNMILMSTIFIILFCGGWLVPFTWMVLVPSFLVLSFKTVIVCFFFVIVRATFPRYRYDQLMNIGWKIFLPISLSYLVFSAGLLLTFDSIPFTTEVGGYNNNNIYSY